MESILNLQQKTILGKFIRAVDDGARSHELYLAMNDGKLIFPNMKPSPTK